MMLGHSASVSSSAFSIDPAHILIAWLAVWLKELSIARLIPSPSIGQCAPVICQASQPCAHSEATHCIKAGAGGALGVDDTVDFFYARKPLDIRLFGCFNA